MNEPLIYEKNFFDVPLQDLPEAGDLMICHDPQKRLGAITWAVLACKGTDEPPLAIGLFWDKAEAVFFANAKYEATK